MSAPTFAARRSLYAKQWASMVIEVPGPVEKAAQKLLKAKPRYQAVASRIGVPWFFIACIHWRESSGSFAGILHNGERIIGTGKTTRLVPKGRGPFASWEEAAVDALSVAPHDMRKVDIDSVERFAFEAEKWNGWGYHYHGVPSAYLWSMSSVYKGGKYVADGKWSAKALDSQVGVMPLLKRLMALDPSIGFGAPAQHIPPDTPAEPDPGDDRPPVKLPTPTQVGIGGVIALLITGLTVKWSEFTAWLAGLWPFN